MDRVVDEHGRLTPETITEAERVFASRPDLLARFVDEVAALLRDSARRPATPARTYREGLVFHNGPTDDAPITDENLPEEVPAFKRPGERTR